MPFQSQSPKIEFNGVEALPYMSAHAKAIKEKYLPFRSQFSSRKKARGSRLEKPGSNPQRNMEKDIHRMETHDEG